MNKKIIFGICIFLIVLSGVVYACAPVLQTGKGLEANVGESVEITCDTRSTCEVLQLDDNTQESWKIIPEVDTDIDCSGAVCGEENPLFGVTRITRTVDCEAAGTYEIICEGNNRGRQFFSESDTLTCNAVECSPTLNEDWVVDGVETCNAEDVTTGTGKIIIAPGGELHLVGNTKVTTYGGLVINRQGDAVFIDSGSQIIIN